MARPRVDAQKLRRPRRIYLSELEIAALGLEGAEFSRWARQKLLGEAKPGSETPPDAIPAPPKEMLLIPRAGEPDAQGWCYHFEARNSRGDGTLTIQRPGKPRLAIDLTQVEITKRPDGQQELRFEDRTHPREIQETTEEEA